MHLKGKRFGFGPIVRIGAINDRSVRIVKWNSHPGCELHFMLRGRFTWEIAKPRRKVSVSGGSFIVIPAGIRHRAAENIGVPSTRIGVICESPKLCCDGSGTSFSPEELKNVFAEITSRPLVPLKTTPGLKATLLEIRSEMEALFKRSGDKLRLRALCNLLLCETARAVSLQSAGAAQKSADDSAQVVEKVREWIRDHLGEQIDGNRLVEISGYGRSRFFSLFGAQTGMTPQNFILRERINGAKAILGENPDMPLSDVAENTGFSSVRTFVAAFRRYVGKSPREWK